MAAVHEAHWDARAWSIFALHVGLVTPPFYFYVFDMLGIHVVWKVLIWFGFVFTVWCLIRSYWFIRYLRWIRNKAYGRHTY